MSLSSCQQLQAILYFTCSFIDYVLKNLHTSADGSFSYLEDVLSHFDDINVLTGSLYSLCAFRSKITKPQLIGVKIITLSVGYTASGLKLKLLSIVFSPLEAV